MPLTSPLEGEVGTRFAFRVGGEMSLPPCRFPPPAAARRPPPPGGRSEQKPGRGSRRNSAPVPIPRELSSRPVRQSFGRLLPGPRSAGRVSRSHPRVVVSIRSVEDTHVPFLGAGSSAVCRRRPGVAPRGARRVRPAGSGGFRRRTTPRRRSTSRRSTSRPRRSDGASRRSSSRRPVFDLTTFDLMTLDSKTQLSPNSPLRLARCAWSRATMLECIWLTRDSLRFSVAPISFIVISS